MNSPLSNLKSQINKRPLRVGFDLDGVLLYNPARIARHPITIVKRLFFPKRLHTFYVPQSEIEKLMWRVFHWSSLFIAPGFNQIKEMSHKGLIEPYIVTARFDFLEPDFNTWIRRMRINDSFKGIYLNKQNQQPHIFKEQIVKELKLDIFVEDNWDIIQHLTQTTKAKTFWIYNIFDRGIQYEYKFPTLKKAVEKIKSY
ncbi:hypothetical protein A3H80_00775 [Candidatus Roizmanbacteria bacterium RIFCSPLOWO2_02_FULL_37_19]|uniref:FCP1 homology domain-containing protein n=1 Tax=Candidatus Roizmanbacteria bacterium RIFCSPHIGHO2_02_FULL_37_24 TaxID=1802037 RepID=A0A1F7GUW9_9BACT|nr:MAG: hypothetical protein A2862_00460 [Candidatus Roizmanbacteria bacterium RIFCSPHIGHO2_01_FULL_38_41]OGK22671.1 MAG: hypothetical protein A3C24_00580 [Candidatus Roizmanbacteria bacterium RIFCSPHIGHO2_02_FULL_37_24]OGK32521.1 MAG: hypothetical protein A3E10_00645 [Candidatus Roizmanbacteria bacterium RIFCSPHIGHO2_12_FULL_37_23]OGK45135.1 MAG: hypothetical protein A2956_03045 [Candidatus Roizmanbacteria bacterium RIFCSPLOWO2_01_FULL_37_57]OGK54501.1 MAG: hypothetical protein A3H80_00775 [Ca